MPPGQFKFIGTHTRVQRENLYLKLPLDVLPEIEERYESIKRSTHDGHEHGVRYQELHEPIGGVRGDVTHAHVEPLPVVVAFQQFSFCEPPCFSRVEEV